MPDVIVEDENGVTRVLIGNIGTDADPDYGLQVTSADGTTVIIDGTSSMFKIARTGTLTQHWAGGALPNINTTFADETIAGLASFPAFLANVVESSGVGLRYPSPYMLINTGAQLGKIEHAIYLTIQPNGAGVYRVTLSLQDIFTGWGAGQFESGRYWIMKEAGI